MSDGCNRHQLLRCYRHPVVGGSSTAEQLTTKGQIGPILQSLPVPSGEAVCGLSISAVRKRRTRLKSGAFLKF